MSTATKGKGLFVLVAAVLIAFSLVFAPMGYYYNIAEVINKVYAQEEGEEEVEVTTDDEEEEPPTTAGDEVVVEEQPTTPEEQPPITATEEEEVQQPLSASLFVDTTNGGTAPATFLFELDVQGGTEPYTFSWDFGDGSPQGSGESLTHTYENPGTYTVTLEVTDSAGQTATDTEQVTVVPPSPLTEVEIFANSTEGVAPATFEFAADIFREETRAFTFSWDFGDGSPQGSGEIVTHTFENPGNYTVTLNVTNPTTGQTVTDTEQVTVQPSTTTTTEEEPMPVLPPTEPTAVLDARVVEELTQAAESANIAISPNDTSVVSFDMGFVPTSKFVVNTTEVGDGPIGVAYVLNETSGESETLVVSMTTDEGARRVTFADPNGTERSRFIWDPESCIPPFPPVPGPTFPSPEDILRDILCPPMAVSASGPPGIPSTTADGQIVGLNITEPTITNDTRINDTITAPGEQPQPSYACNIEDRYCECDGVAGCKRLIDSGKCTGEIGPKPGEPGRNICDFDVIPGLPEPTVPTTADEVVVEESPTITDVVPEGGGVEERPTPGQPPTNATGQRMNTNITATTALQGNVTAGPESPVIGETAQQALLEDRLRAGGGEDRAWGCIEIGCICFGDDSCADMFDTDVCPRSGEIIEERSKCTEVNGETVCVCLR